SVAALRGGISTAGQARQTPDPCLAAKLHRALRKADGRGRKGIRRPVASPGSFGRLVDDLRNHRPQVSASFADGVSAAVEARPRLSAGSADAVGYRLSHGGRAGGARGSRTAGRVPSHPISGGRWTVRRDRDDQTGTDSGV